jgi:hypothetical protein
VLSPAPLERQVPTQPGGGLDTPHDSTQVNPSLSRLCEAFTAWSLAFTQAPLPPPQSPPWQAAPPQHSLGVLHEPPVGAQGEQMPWLQMPEQQSDAKVQLFASVLQAAHLPP